MRMFIELKWNWAQSWLLAYSAKRKSKTAHPQEMREKSELQHDRSIRFILAATRAVVMRIYALCTPSSGNIHSKWNFTCQVKCGTKKKHTHTTNIHKRTNNNKKQKKRVKHTEQEAKKQRPAGSTVMICWFKRNENHRCYAITWHRWNETHVGADVPIFIRSFAGISR